MGADLVLANDPDADRCAAAVPDPAAVSEANPGGWRMLRGDEVGALLGAHILSPRGRRGRGLRQLDRLLAAARGAGRAAGVRHEETLTGFKWIARVPGLRYGYEEALGYCVDPRSVQDKDGVSAALLLAEMAAGLRAQGRTLLDVLDDLAVAHGLHATDAFSVRVADLSLIADGDGAAALDPARAGRRGAGRPGSTTSPRGQPDLPPTDGLRYHLADGSRVIVRPSGTEPKLKAYLEVIVPVAGRPGLPAARVEAAARLDRIRAVDDGAHRPLTHGRTGVRLGRPGSDQGEEPRPPGTAGRARARPAGPSGS